MADERHGGKNGKKGGRFGVRPVFLIAGAIALLAFGIIFGATLDLATRPPKPQVVAAPGPPPKPSHPHGPPSLKIEPDAMPDPSPGSIFEDPNQPRTGPVPQRAWADPEAGAASPVPNAAPNAVPNRVTNAVAVPVTNGVVIAVVIDDMGLDRPRSLKAIALPGPLTLSLMTYADDLPGLVAQARKAGHEVMGHLPMEPISPKENPGPGALRVNMDEAAIRGTLAADLDGWSGYVGINNHMGSKFTADRARMDVVMAELRTRGLLWLDSKTTGDSAGPAAARAAGVPYVERDVFLDNVETVEAVNAQLAQLVATAKAHGTAIGIGHPHDATLAALRQWLPELAARGITLVPVTEILRRNTMQQAQSPG